VDPAGTLTVTTAAMFALITANATGGAFVAATARTNISDVPPTIGTSADGFCQITTSTADYVQIPMATYTTGAAEAVAAVRMLACGWAASATAATIAFAASTDGTTYVFLVASPGVDPNFDASTTTPAWAAKTYNPAGGWTQAKLNGLTFRVGYSDDAAPDIGIHGIYAEVYLQPTRPDYVFGGAGDLRVEQDTDPSSGAILALHAYTPADQSATLVYELSGVEQTPVVVAAGSNPQTVTINAPDLPTVNRIELRPDEPA
jgi:hypothetical protein